MTIHREGRGITLAILIILVIIGLGCYMIFPELLTWWYILYSAEALFFLFIVRFF